MPANWNHNRVTSANKLQAEKSEALSSYESSRLSWKIPFGKYQGTAITSIPLSYLEFIRNNSNNKDVTRRCSEECDRRYRISRSLQDRKTIV